MDKNTTKQLFIVTYHHRHGTDVWLSLGSITEEEVIEKLKAADEWEGDTRDDEYVEITGPFEIPA